MKKIIYLMMAVVLPFMFVGCSDDDENNFEDQLVGTWVEDTNSTIEVMNLVLNADKTGLHWTEDNGVVDPYWGKKNLVWSATKDKLTLTMVDENGNPEEYGPETVPYHFSEGKLYAGEIVYKRK